MQIAKSSDNKIFASWANRLCIQVLSWFACGQIFETGRTCPGNPVCWEA